VGRMVRMLPRALMAETVFIPVAVGFLAWILTTITSRRSEAWNDHRYWWTMHSAAFVLGLILRGNPWRIGLLLGASASAGGMVQSIIHVKNPALLPAVPVILLLCGSACVLPTRAGAVARAALDRLAPHRVVPPLGRGHRWIGKRTELHLAPPRRAMRGLGWPQGGRSTPPGVWTNPGFHHGVERAVPPCPARW